MTTLDRYVGLNGFVLITPLAKETKTASGIIIPDTASGRRNKAVSGQVVKSSQTNVVKEGYTVYYREGLGMEVVLDGKTYLLMREADLLCGLASEN